MIRVAGVGLFAVSALVPLPPSIVLWALVMARGLLWR